MKLRNRFKPSGGSSLSKPGQMSNKVCQYGSNRASRWTKQRALLGYSTDGNNTSPRDGRRDALLTRRAAPEGRIELMERTHTRDDRTPPGNRRPKAHVRMQGKREGWPRATNTVEAPCCVAHGPGAAFAPGPTARPGKTGRRCPGSRRSTPGRR